MGLGLVTPTPSGPPPTRGVAALRKDWAPGVMWDPLRPSPAPMTRGPYPYHRPLGVGDLVPSLLAQSPECTAHSRWGGTPPCGPRGAANSSAVHPYVLRTVHRVVLHAIRSATTWGVVSQRWLPSPDSGWWYWVPYWRKGGVEHVGLALVGVGPSVDGAAHRDMRQLTRPTAAGGRDLLF